MDSVSTKVDAASFKYLLSIFNNNSFISGTLLKLCFKPIISLGVDFPWLTFPNILSISRTSLRIILNLFNWFFSLTNALTTFNRLFNLFILFNGRLSHCFNFRPPPFVTVSSNKSINVP